MSTDPIFAIRNYGQTYESSSSSSARNVSLDYDTFLQLLIAEMQNQDPLQPMDSSEYVAQLASFSNVEQTIVTNNKLDELFAATMISQAGSIIGKTITSADGEVTGVVESVRFVTGGAIAILEDGREVVMSNGMMLSESGATPDSEPEPEA
ncbi:flagellar hook assembly protein FlgD [Filomicrobium sp.]|uniref:flagellar hook assembly protein FlgD n=1 Tax=Filomicrobium sp. TaxID=2024831 RepID=UPI00258349DD|nr:flagellar hook assembly protein FlgD [Filomicrobium sp.]MCV0371591.1 flagellar hook assembly protein FlgD [Filomicrobium sp.]